MSHVGCGSSFFILVAPFRLFIASRVKIKPAERTEVVMFKWGRAERVLVVLYLCPNRPLGDVKSSGDFCNRNSLLEHLQNSLTFSFWQAFH